MKQFSLLFCGFFLVLSAYSQSIVYVTPAGAGNNSGSSWTNALSGLQLPNRVATADSGTQFWIAAGTYKPTTTTDRTASFSIASGLSVYGGFAGTEASLEQRINGSNETIFSGDIGQEGYAQDNSQSVLWIGLFGGQTCLNGLTIRDGHRLPGDKFYYIIKQNGVGISTVFFKKKSHLLIENCKIIENISEDFGTGGGLSVLLADSSQSNVTIKKCLFSQNQSYSGGAYLTAQYTKGIIISLIEDCVFSNNSAVGGYGGAIYSTTYDSTVCSLKIKNSQFLSNQATYSGGSLYSNWAQCQIESSWFVNNTVTNGTGGAIDVQFASMNFNNCIFSNNNATYGGVLHSSPIANTKQDFVNCTFISNTARQSGGVFSNYSGYVLSSNDVGIWADFSENKVNLKNCLIWQNVAPDEPVFKSQIYSNFTPPQVDFSTTYSLIQNGYPGTGNLNTDPLFVDPALGNFRLQPTSPAVNAGSPDITDLLPTDITGNPRIQGNRVDMGAYEFTGCTVCLPLSISKTR